MYLLAWWKTADAAAATSFLFAGRSQIHVYLIRTNVRKYKRKHESSIVFSEACVAVRGAECSTLADLQYGVHNKKEKP